MLFDAMSFLYQSIPAMKLTEEIQARHVAELTEKEEEPGPRMANGNCPQSGG
jgi:hypothetical protein